MYNKYFSWILVMMVVLIGLCGAIALPTTAKGKTYTTQQITDICSDRAISNTKKEFKQRFKTKMLNKYDVYISWKAWNTGESSVLYKKAEEEFTSVFSDVEDPLIKRELIRNSAIEYYNQLLNQNEYYISNYWEKFLNKRLNKINQYEKKQNDKCVNKFLNRYDSGLIEIID